jgi:hypothetical protein
LFIALMALLLIIKIWRTAETITEEEGGTDTEKIMGKLDRVISLLEGRGESNQKEQKDTGKDEGKKDGQ